MTLAWMPIKLTQELYALVDAEDFERLNKHKWHAHKGGRTYYAERHPPAQNGKQQIVCMHREILQLPKGVHADHRSGYGLDNRRTNLRPATLQQNQFNRRLQGGKSKYKGVVWHKGAKKWQAQIRFNSKEIYLGLFRSEVDAAKAYDKAAKKLFGEFVRTNF